MGAEEHYGPLESLCRILRPGPPRISALLNILVGADEYNDFVDLVREFLPGQVEDILGAGGDIDMVEAFCRVFGEHYFPLEVIEQGVFWGEEEEPFSFISCFIPITVHGLEEDDYHYLPERNLGFLIGTLLVNFEAEIYWEGEGVRATIMETVERDVPKELLKRLPPQGYSLAFLKANVPARHVGLVRIAEYLCHDTDCIFLDATYEDLACELPTWDREAVDFLTAEWAKFARINDEIGSFMTWIEGSPEGRLKELVNYLERRAHGRGAKSKLGAASGTGDTAR